MKKETYMEMLDSAKISSEILCGLINKIGKETVTNEEFSSDVDQLLDHYLLLVVFSIIEKCMTAGDIKDADKIRKAMISVFMTAIDATEKLKIETVFDNEKIKAFHLVLKYQSLSKQKQDGFVAIMRDGELNQKLDELLKVMNNMMHSDNKDFKKDWE